MTINDTRRGATPTYLLPCAFCGCTKSPVRQGNGIGDYWLECTDCGASTRLREDGAGSEKDWNRRPDSQSPVDESRESAAIMFSGNSLTLSGAQLLEALDFVAPDRDRDQLESELTFQRGEGHAGNGMYCWLTEYPEEGALFVDGSTVIPTDAAAAGAPASAPVGPTGGWQPIETVPKDGTEVVLLFDDEVALLGKTRPRVRAASWLVDWTIPYRRDNPPTHWMPLPAAPIDAVRAGGQ